MTALPQFLTLPSSTEPICGALRKLPVAGTNSTVWEIYDAEPNAVAMAKRLFPGAQGRGAGHAKFPANKRSFADLVWFMQRYPLRIDDAVEFDRDYQATCAYVAKREDILRNPATCFPEALFKGELRVYQQEGLDWGLTNRRTLIADGTGLGKTVLGLAFLATDQRWPALIVAEPHLVRHWEQFATNFLDVGNTSDGSLFSQGKPLLHVIRGTKTADLPEANIYVIHYLLLRKWRRALMERGIRRILFDEIQSLRRTGTEKYSAASELSSHADDVIGLSATPIYNRGGEIHAVMNIIEYHCLGDWDSFTREWCAGYGSDVVKDPERLNAYLRREGLMLRRRKEDVAQHLPKKQRIVEFVDSDKSVFAQLVAEASRIAKNALHVQDNLARGRMERDAINQSRMATGIAKAPAVAAFVRGMLEADEPTLVFAHHHAVVDTLLDELKEFNPVCITGRQTEKQKWEAKEAFQAGKTNLCIIALRSATGIDGLQQRARVVVFAELDWSPAIHTQGEDRAHRDGQKHPVLCYYLVADAGTDPDVMEALGFKIAQFTGIMGDTPETESDRELSGQQVTHHMQAVLAKLRQMPAHRRSEHDGDFQRFISTATEEYGDEDGCIQPQ